MKHLLSKISILFFLAFSVQVNLYAQIGTWAELKNRAPQQSAGLMLLLTDGRVLCQDAADGEQGWMILTPDSVGSYLNGTWVTTGSNFQEHLFCNSQVMPNGEVMIAGGEYGDGDTAGEIYNPVAGTWSRTEGVTNKDNIYDGNSEILPNGKILSGPQVPGNNSAECLYYTPSTNKWSQAPTAPLNHDEAEWLKLPDSSILFVGMATQKSCRFRPQTNTWINDANVPVSISDTFGYECGPGVLLPNGKGIFFGGYVYNAIYTPSGGTANGSWVAAAEFPTISGGKVGITDGPGAMMVNGHILLSVSPVGTSDNNEFLNPAYFMEYDYTTDTFTQVTSTIPGINSDEISSNTCSNMTFLDLPDGTVLVDESQNNSATLNEQYYIYTPGSGPIAQGKPTINNVFSIGECNFYKATGKLFNGISEGTEYGDDLQQSSNYPLIRLTAANGNVYYCKTTNWNRIGAVMTDSLEDTTVFETPATLPAGTYSLVVVANGFASNPTIFTQAAPMGLTTSSVNSTTTPCNGEASVTITSGGTAPFTYSWSPGGATTASINNECGGQYCCTVTDNNGCMQTTCVNIITGIENIGNASNINIFPDPAVSSFTVSGITKGQVISLYNIVGQQLSSEVVTKTTMYFNIANQADGVYIIKVMNQDGSLAVQKKIVKGQ